MLTRPKMGTDSDDEEAFFEIFENELRVNVSHVLIALHGLRAFDLTLRQFVRQFVTRPTVASHHLTWPISVEHALFSPPQDFMLNG